MIDVKVLGTGCANCKTTTQLIEKVAKENNIPVTLEKVEDIQDIMAYGVMSTPGVVVNGKIAHAGGVPDAKSVLTWLHNAAQGTEQDAKPGTEASGGCCGGKPCC